MLQDVRGAVTHIQEQWGCSLAQCDDPLPLLSFPEVAQVTYAAHQPLRAGQSLPSGSCQLAGQRYRCRDIEEELHTGTLQASGKVFAKRKHGERSWRGESAEEVKGCGHSGRPQRALRVMLKSLETLLPSTQKLSRSCCLLPSQMANNQVPEPLLSFQPVKGQGEKKCETCAVTGPALRLILCCSILKFLQVYL